MLFFPICIESYSTIERSLAVSVTGSVGRIGGIIAPFAIYSIFLVDNYLPFFIYAVCALIMLITMLTYPIDNTGQGMESKS